MFAFDTSTIESTILGTQTGMIVTYTDANGNVLPSPLPDPFNTSSQTITVHVENALSTFCFDETTFNFVIDAQPVANTITDNFICDDISNNGIHEFTFSDYDSQILNTQSNTVFEVFYYDTNANAVANISPLSNLYLLTAPQKTIHVRIQNINNPTCYAITTFDIGIYFTPIAHFSNELSVCDDPSNDGIEVFNLDDQNIQILGGQIATDNTITYHSSITEANNGINVLPLNYSNQSNPETIYVRIENNVHPECYTTSSFQLIVNEKPVLLMDDQWSICEYDTVEIVADSGHDSYLWSTGETTNTIIVTTPGTYLVTATNFYGALECETTKSISVIASNVATITNINTIDWTQNDNVISIYADGLGDYEYSLNGYDYQDSNQFTNLQIAEYTVFVRDKNGCGVVSEDLYLLYYPKFFTPNGDGINDYWQLFNSAKEPQNNIYIFDRYGKIVAHLNPESIGWNGLYNGSPLPATDYWFLLERKNGKKYRGHFSLKR